MQADFRQSSASFHGSLRHYWVVLLLLLLAWLTLVLIGGIASTLEIALSVLAMLFLYGWGRLYVWVSLDINGMLSGLTGSGTRLRLTWQERVAVRSAVRVGLAGVLLKSMDGTRELFIPSDILKRPEFQAAVQQLAPEGHPLRRQSVA